jgi:hypothetical protein
MLYFAFYVILSWTAVGNVGMEGVPAYYDIRYSTSVITEANFDNCDQFRSPVPLTPGTPMSCCIDKLYPRKYYFAVKAVSKTGLKANISNIAYSPTSYYMKGDPNTDKKINIGDVTYLINFVFNNGKQPIPMDAGDTNDDGKINVGDIGYLINYIFNNGPYPCDKE